MPPRSVRQLADPAGERPAGEARLTLGVRDGRTRLIRSRTRPPLFVQRALYVDEALPDLAVVHLINPTAGVLAGDRLVVEVGLEARARARVTTQSATKLYAMPEGEASQETRLTARNAYTAGKKHSLPLAKMLSVIVRQFARAGSQGT